jgi:hypothetical protein
MTDICLAGLQKTEKPVRAADLWDSIHGPAEYEAGMLCLKYKG